MAISVRDCFSLRKFDVCTNEVIPHFTFYLYYIAFGTLFYVGIASSPGHPTFSMLHTEKREGLVDFVM